ncbi:S8 family serine peptidase [Deinococcus sp. SM5_A1]|uniref:S8 family serine peptidase n=1 Tax=Deinococcus sp. SM5_A1 TaxID=3379094 RepID=UPI003859DC0C
MTSKKPRTLKPQATQKATATKERAPARRQTGSDSSDQPIPERIYAQASPRSLGSVSMFDAGAQINSATVPNFYSSQDVVEQAVRQLMEAGFEVLQVSPLTINIAGTRETYDRAFNTTIIAEERPVIKAFMVEDTAQFLDSPDTAMPGLIRTEGTAFEQVLEGVALEEPRYFMAPSMFPPPRSYWHLNVPADVSLACNADRAHRGGITGRGVTVAMCDSGWYRHPYFVGRGYSVAPVVLGPGAANPLADESGHGTGESANIFALAPDINFMPVKMNFVNTVGAFNAAVGLSPQIITCSWGSSKQFGPLSAADNAMAAAIAAAVAAGIVVVFSAGNGHWGFPGQHPDVISAGGVFMNPDESLRASDYASGFMSNIYPGRRVPDLSGLVGMRPKAAYIMLPLEPGDEIDTDLAGSTHPDGDETAADDGWATFSGTSAAAPQLAGAAALIRQACPRLTPAEVRSILMSTARDVTAGNGSANTGGNPATVGPDTATGNGLVDAHKAVMIAKLRCLGPISPPIGIHPPIAVQPPVRPPIIPIQPPISINPPIRPPMPIQPPISPPVIPIRPIGPVVLPPIGPQSESPDRPASEPGQTLSARDVQELEELVHSGELDTLEP